MKPASISVLFSLLHDFFKVYLPKQKNCSPHTIRSYRNSMEALLDFVKIQKNVKLSEITFEMLDQSMISNFLDMLEEARGCSIATRNHRLHCIRAFYEYAANMEPTVTTFKAEISKITTKKPTSDKSVEHMSENAVRAILAQPDTAAEKGVRDQCLLVLLYDSAARVQEILDVKVCDVRITDVPIVALHGKGGKIRSVPIMKKTAEHLKRYIARFHPNTTSFSDDYLFYTKHSGQKKRMCEDNVRRMLNGYAQSARKVYPAIPDKVHPHLMRHSRAMHLYQHGMELTLISQWLGHANYETTLIYAHADTEQKRKAIQAATESNNALHSVDGFERFTVDDELTLKRLCGLK